MSTKNRVIVVAVDPSPRAALVVEAARLMADRLDAKVALISAVEGMELQALVPPELAAFNDSTIWNEMDAAARKAVATAASSFRQGTVIDEKVEAGPAWRVIKDAAIAHHAAIIVIGAHTYRPVERLLGTTAAKIANRADCSVLIARQAKGAKAAVGFERIAVAHDGSERSQRVLAAAEALARPSRGRLTLIRAVQPPADITSAVWGARPDELMAMLVQREKTQLEQVRGALPDAIAAETEARIGTPADVVLDIARGKDAGLIVIGSHGYDPIDRVLGTTAGRIANNADRSVLIVRGDGLVS
ncbi:MAG: universal stress protein [Deltaproteobacteria bacterium]|nr:universal stress protein [Deltaproteobacteria bacterium]